MAMVPAFRCSHSGLYFPPDYTKNWGKKYGIGLGNVPVSEVLDTEYHGSIDMSVPATKRMCALGVTRAQVDFCMVDEEEYNKNRAILAIDDPDYTARVAKIKPKQMVKSEKLRYVAE